MKKCFVTVGTTCFDALIQTVLSLEFLTCISKLDYNELTIQSGNSQYTLPDELMKISENHASSPETHPESNTIPFIHEQQSQSFYWKSGKINVHVYKFKPCLSHDMSHADTIISHAGSGSILESLELGKILLVCVNTSLMDNHQQELAMKLETEGHLLSCLNVQQDLSTCFQRSHRRTLKPFVVGVGKKYVSKVLEEVVGF